MRIISRRRFDFEEDFFLPFSSAFEYIQERRQTKTAETAVSGTKTEPRSAGAKMLWRAFQFAFRVYSFAGGHDDRADMLTRELAHEIETDPHHQ